jgi:hypothetical protein
LREAIEPALRLPEAPDIVEAAEAVDGVEEDRRKGQAPGYPYRPPTLGRRQSRRQRVLLAGLIVDIEAETVIRCRVDNVSATGARLRVPDRQFLPARFWLIAVTAGLAYRASIARRDGDRLGVSVDSPLDLNEAVGRSETRLRSLWMRSR